MIVGSPRAQLLRAVRVVAVSLLFARLAVSVAAVTTGPDAGGYTATNEAVYSFVDIAGFNGAASVLSGEDDAVVALALPFDFAFYGDAYDTACVSSNGALYLVNESAACTGMVDFANTSLLTSTPPTDPPSILPFWSDLSFAVNGAGAVFYQVSGTEGSRTFVVQWNNAFPENSVMPVTFQVVLSEATGRILFQYKQVDLGNTHPATKGAAATIGIHNAGGLGTNEQIEWSHKTPVINDQSVVLFETSATQTTPVLSWVQPDPIIYGAALGPDQLDATADVAGTFAYTPPAGTVLNVGSNQTLSVLFTPNDQVKYTTAMASVTVSVIYNTAVGHALLQPVNTTGPRSSFRAGSTIPLKFQLFKADGVTPVTDATATLEVTQLNASCSTAVNEASQTASADAGTTFRYDAALQQYVYNLRTGRDWCGTYQLKALLNDGSAIAAIVEIRNR